VDAVGAGVKQGLEYSSLELEEVKTCLLGIKSAWEVGFCKLVIEWDCLSLFLKLKQRQNPRSPLGMTIVNILSFA